MSGLMTAQSLQQVSSNLLTGVFFAYLSFQEHSASAINLNKVELLHSIKGHPPYHFIFERLPPYPEGFSLGMFPL